jgi:transporter family-2 protein
VDLSLLLVAFGTGMAIAVQPVINAAVAARAGHPVLGALISVTVTFLALLAATLALRQPLPGPRMLAGLPGWLYVGGLIGAVFLFASLYVTPRLGVATTFALIIAGQLTAALLVDSFGWLGIPERPLTPLRIVGAVCLLAGVLLVRLF